MARVVDGLLATDQTAFNLEGGLYGITVQATFGGGSVKLQKQCPDGTTYVSVASATDFSAAGYSTVSIPKGIYRFTIATATAVQAAIDRIPGE